MSYPNKLTPEWLTSNIETVSYTRVPDTTTTICSIILNNGFVVTETSACIDPSNYDKTIGEKIALEACKARLWELYGFAITENTFQNSFAFISTSNLGFGEAIERLKEGSQVARDSWNKGYYLYYVPANTYPKVRNLNTKEETSEMVPYSAYIALRKPDGSVSPWSVQGDAVFAQDWYVL